MTTEQFTELKRLQDRMISDRERYEDDLEDIAQYILPHRYNWDENEEYDGERPTVYDATAVEANRVLADGYQGYLINPRAPWLNIKAEDEKAQRSSKVQQWRKLAESGLYKILARSNFYSAMGMCLLDGAFGTATMYTEPHPDTIVNFIPQHLKGIYIAQNRHGVIDTVFHSMRMFNRDIVNTYGEAIPKDKRDDMKKNPFTRQTVWRAVLPNANRIMDAIGPKGMKYSSITYMEGMDDPLKESGYNRMPYDFWRPMICTGESYGKSAAWYALGDIKRLNVIQRDLLELSSVVVKPPLNVPGEQMDSINVTPWGMNPYSDPSRQVFPMQIGGNYPYGEAELSMLQKQVRSYFQVEAFQLLSMMADKEYTATQAAEMAGEKSAQLTSLTSRVTSFLSGILENVLEIAIKEGEIPAPPEELLNGGLRIDYVSPLTMDQERAFRTTGLLRGLNQIIPYIELKPDLWDLIKDDDVFTEILVGSGFPETLMQPKSVVKATRDARAKQQQEQQALDNQKSQMQAYKDGTWEPAEGSASEKALAEAG